MRCATWYMTRSYVTHDSLIREKWLIHTWDMTRSHVYRHLGTMLICSRVSTRMLRGMRRVVHVWDMTRSYVDSFTCGTWRTHTCKEIWRYECTCLDPCLFIGGTGFLFIRGTGLTCINFEEIWSHHAIGCGYSHTPDTYIYLHMNKYVYTIILMMRVLYCIGVTKGVA